MRVYRQKRTINSKTVETGLYLGRYRLPWMSAEKTVALKTSDKRIAEKRLHEFCRVKELQHEKMPVPSALWGAPSLELSKVLGDYLASLRAQNRKEKHIEDTGARICRLMKECGWHLLEDINGALFERWRSSKPLGIRSHKPMSPKSMKEYLVSMRAFIKWIIGAGYIEKDPLAAVPQVDVRGCEIHARRAWTDEELKKFLNACPSGHIDYRPAIYILAMTGLRREELQKLYWGDVHLDGEAPYLIVRAVNAKNRKSEPVPLHPETAEYLAKMRPVNAAQTERVLAFEIPRPRKLQKDLEALGIEYKNELGFLDFHALRHTYGTYLSSNGMPLVFAQRMMRHSDPRLTAVTYTDASQLPVAAELKKLPGLLENRTRPCTFSVVGEGQKQSHDGKSIDFAEVLQRIEHKVDSLTYARSVTHCQSVENGRGDWIRRSNESSQYFGAELVKVTHGSSAPVSAPSGASSVRENAEHFPVAGHGGSVSPHRRSGKRVKRRGDVQEEGCATRVDATDMTQQPDLFGLLELATGWSTLTGAARDAILDFARQAHKGGSI